MREEYGEIVRSRVDPMPQISEFDGSEMNNRSIGEVMRWLACQGALINAL
jgi:hypothetical protein